MDECDLNAMAAGTPASVPSEPPPAQRSGPSQGRFRSERTDPSAIVIPAEAGISATLREIPACAGMTGGSVESTCSERELV
jgi:hypothetical protein